jgi:hypothetical protein
MAKASPSSRRLPTRSRSSPTHTDYGQPLVSDTPVTPQSAWRLRTTGRRQPRGTQQQQRDEERFRRSGASTKRVGHT